MMLGRCTVMGVVNVTPASSPDGGSYATADVVGVVAALRAAAAPPVPVGAR